MPEFLSQFGAPDMALYACVKLIGFGFIISSALLYRLKAPFSLYAFSLGLWNALAYTLFVQGNQRLFWGLQGDEVTIAAMYEMFAHGGFFRDFAYAHLPPFYPPLFFWIFAFAGKIFGMHGILIGKMASAVSIFLGPLFIFFLARTVAKRYEISRTDFFGLLVAAGSTVLFSWDVIILKPYEWLTAFGVVGWSALLLFDVREKQMTARKIFAYGISGGILFLTYYFWFFLAALGVSLSLLFQSSLRPVRTYARLIVVGLIMLFVSMPFLAPLVQSYHGGTENWQHGYVLLSGLASHLFPSFSLYGILFVLGLASLVYFSREKLITHLLPLFGAAYVWQAMGIFTIAFLNSPLQESKGFHFWNTAIVCFALAYGAIAFFERLRGQVQKEVSRSFVILGIALLWWGGFFGSFVDDPVALNTRVIARHSAPGIQELAAFLRDRDAGRLPVTLHGGIAELYAWAPVNSFIYFNQNNSHPAAFFSERLLVIEDMSRTTSTDELVRVIQEQPFGSIERFIFPIRTTSTHQLWFHIDNYPQGTKELVLSIKQDIFRRPPFVEVYRSDYFVVYEIDNQFIKSNSK